MLSRNYELVQWA